MVTLSTTLGDIVIELFEDDAPLTTQNFLDYVDAGFYDGTIFHRVISGFMIQGGGFTEEMDQKDTGPPIQNEGDNGQSNVRGTLAMARTGFPHSATAQFFINLVDNTFLDHSDGTFGYAVFGRVAEGMDVVDRIAAVDTGDQYDYQNVPVEPVIIQTARRNTA